MRGSRPPSNTWFPGPTQVVIRNGISIDSVVFFAGLTSVTDHTTWLVTIDRIYVRSTAMRPNKTNTNDNMYSAVNMARPLQEFIQFI